MNLLPVLRIFLGEDHVVWLHDSPHFIPFFPFCLPGRKIGCNLIVPDIEMWIIKKEINDENVENMDDENLRRILRGGEIRYLLLRSLLSSRTQMQSIIA